MKKSFYTFMIAMAFLGILSTSCHKDNLKPDQTVKQSGNTGTASGGGSQASVPAAQPYDPCHPPTCPSHDASH